jgi:hypothetical protein
LATGAALLYLGARSRPARALAVLLAAFPSLSMSVFGLGWLAAINLLIFRPQLGSDLYNYAMFLLTLSAVACQGLLSWPAFALLRRWAFPHGASRAQGEARPATFR